MKTTGLVGGILGPEVISVLQCNNIRRRQLIMNIWPVSGAVFDNCTMANISRAHMDEAYKDAGKLAG
jgi:hypothetical protein